MGKYALCFVFCLAVWYVFIAYGIYDLSWVFHTYSWKPEERALMAMSLIFPAVLAKIFKDDLR